MPETAVEYARPDAEPSSDANVPGSADVECDVVLVSVTRLISHHLHDR